ncbi:MAG TPA: LuxR C-terminal-related transcriptional regulator [Nocardioides sp.]|nr:LuxR C-terminal-related transcriptional regulator [Nocardioides sp.]
MLVGRTTELHRLREALSRDHPVAVVGEAGIGKTTLLRAAAERTGRPVREGGALSTLSWMEYLPLERALASPLVGGDPTAVAGDVETAVGAGVLLLDDLQWAAAPTVEVVELLAGRVAMLAGVRSGDPGTDAVLERLAGAGFEIVELGGLTADDAAAVALAVSPDLGAATVARLAERTGGNPLLLRELAATGEASPSLRLAIGARLRALDEVARETFGLLALAGRPLPADAFDPLGAKALLAADLAVTTPDGELQVRHALLGEVAVDQLDDDRRRDLHATLARLTDDPGDAARHHQQAGETALAYDAAVRAAAEAVRPGERASHLAVAASCASGPDAHDLRLQAAAALEEVHDWPALQAVLAELASGPPDVRARAALLRARAAWRAGDADGLRTAIEHGLAEVTTGSDVELELRIEACRIPLFIESDADEAVRQTAAALADARAAGVDVPRAQYLHGTALYIAERPEEGAAELAEALAAAGAAGDVSVELPAANNLIALDESMGDPAEAREIATAYAERARALGLGVWERSFRIARSNLDFHAGDYPAVLAAADELLALPLEERSRDILVEQQCLALVDLGRIDEALRRLDAAPSRPGDQWWERGARWVRCQAALWGGRPALALELSVQMLQGPAGDLNNAFAHCSRAWALLELDRDPGPPVSSDYPGMLAAVVPEAAGVIALAEDRYDEAIELFDAATRTWAGYHRRGELLCRWASDEAARRAGHTDAVDRLVATEEVVAAAGMLPLLGRVHRSLRAAGVRRSAPRAHEGAALLSAREQEVLRLVADGLTNAEIAARLGVSRHTVVSQVASASMKLGASNRTQAAAMAVG